ncbi:MAG: AAA family ATPase [Acidobacteria bacterium]|nr:AAA family ATPase [Acidobacteriota bacterium]
MFSRFLGNSHVVTALQSMLAEQRLPQTLLFAGPAGVGKATLARLLAAALNCKPGPAEACGKCTHCRRILAADPSLPYYQKLFEERAGLTLEKRRENPLVVSTHPEFLCFPPDGPLPQISIEQVRRLKNYAQFGPSEGRRRVFLVDQADRIDTAAANSLLKTLEEPPPYLTLVITSENAYDLLPTIRSRCVPFFFGPLSASEMEQFLASRAEIGADDRRRLAAWAQGSPGRALAIDIEVYERRREAMLALLRAGARASDFGDVIRHTEVIGRNKHEKLELQLDVLYGLLQDLLRLEAEPGAGSAGEKRQVINEDIRDQLASLAAKVDFQWLERAVSKVDELDSHARRNIQKQIALEAFAVSLR